MREDTLTVNCVNDLLSASEKREMHFLEAIVLHSCWKFIDGRFLRCSCDHVLN